MSRLTWPFVLLCSMASAGWVSAEIGPSATGAKALDTCTGAESAAQLSCLSYLVGFVHGLTVQSYLSDRKLTCIPDGVTPEQLRRVVVKWLEEHPENLHESAMGEVALALKNAFPCPAGK